MLKAFIIALLAIAGTRQDCKAGCLKCDTAGNCLVADLTNNYYLNGTTATKITLDNCQMITHDGKCSLCDSKYYVDSTTGKCVAVPTANLITNCEYYSTATACTICATDYYLSANACVAVETAITNCLYYSGVSSCSYCKDGYLLSLDATTCVAAPTTSNCSDYSFVECKTCESGYVLYPNNYLTYNFGELSTSDKNDLANYAYDIQLNYEQLIGQYACQVDSTDNCSDFDEGTNTCTACLFGWYLDSDAMCIAYPDEPIYECAHYSAVSTCIECNNGFYFKSGKCTAIDGTNSIANCATYNNAATSVQCLACSSNFYLTNNSCTARDKSADNKITNCATYAVSADKCGTCASGYVLTTDGLTCNAAIAFCDEHNDVSTGQTLTCKTCSSGRYLKNTTVDGTLTTSCEEGTVANCSEFTTDNGGSCTICKNGFYLLSNECKTHNTISGCTVYDATDAHTCNTCTDTENFNFVRDMVCQSIPSGSLITNCATYSGTLDNVVCDSCNSKYYLIDNTCESITIDNCATMDGSLCASCQTGYALNYNAESCIAAPGYLTDQCAEDSTSEETVSETSVNVTCNYCKENAVPYDFINHFVCMNASEVANYFSAASSSSVLVTGCTKYDSDGLCVQCDPASSTPYLSIGDGSNTCVASCTNNYAKYTLDANNQIDAFNVCDPVTNTGNYENCLVVAPSVTTDGGYTFADNICIKCQSGYITVAYTNEGGYSNVDPDATSFDNYFPSPFAKYPRVYCYARTVGTTKISGSTSNSFVTNCAYYYDFNTDDYGCIKCAQGYTGSFNSNDYIDTCTRDSNCTTDKYYNLDYDFEILASCHKCTSTSSVPVLAYESVNGTTDVSWNAFLRYSNSVSGGVFTNTSGTQKNIVCRSNVATSLGVSNTLASNCGLAVLLINTDGTGDGLFCGACKPGYKDASATGLVKSTCTQINNCASNTTMFNGCSSCNSGYILEYDTTDDTVYFDTCLAVPNSLSAKLANCYAASASGSNADECKVCKRGYNLNSDGFCEALKPYQCETNYFRFSTSNAQNTIDYALYLQNTGVGCHKCSTSYYAVELAANKSVCVTSSWVNTYVDSIAVDSTNYIPHCKYYNSNADSWVCEECDANYVINGDSAYSITGDTCYINTSINNCAVAQSATVCLKCTSELYSLKNNKCELGAISNCVAYNFDSNDTTVNCTKCAADYYLDTDNNKCVEGNIYNCLYLEDNNPNACNECQSGYSKVTVAKDDYIHCYPIDSSLGCSDWTLTNSDIGGTVTCNTCTSTSTQLPGVIESTDNQTVCLDFYQIPNCAQFDVGTTLSESNFICLECNSGYYLDEYNNCVARTNQPAKCVEYSIDEDKCVDCDNTSYLSNNF